MKQSKLYFSLFFERGKLWFLDLNLKGYNIQSHPPTQIKTFCFTCLLESISEDQSFCLVEKGDAEKIIIGSLLSTIIIL